MVIHCFASGERLERHQMLAAIMGKLVLKVNDSSA